MNELGNEQEQAAITDALEKLHQLRDDWSDEIPEEMLNGLSENKKFKVRGNWFQGIIAKSEFLMEFAPKDAPERAEIEEIINYFCTSEEFSNKMATRVDQTDIDKGNRLINLTLALFD